MTTIYQLNGPHLKECACGCGIHFHGRRNQKYFDVKHKALVNNEKRALRNELLADIFAQMSNNLRILLKFYPKSKGIPILLSPLLKEGFDPNAPCRFQKDRNTGIEYRLLTDYYFLQSEDNKTILINKIPNGNNTK
jgi:hypothetical protein